MAELIFFLISFCLVLFSSYFLTTLVKSKRLANSILYFILILVSQVVISFEVLSLVKQILPDNFLFVNFLVFLFSYKFWDMKGKPQIGFCETLIVKEKIIKTLKKDKVLLFLFALFVFSTLITLFLAVVVPNNSPDSLQYHLSRIGAWIQNHGLSHFETPDVRQNIYSVNSELLLMWSMLFFKKDYLATMLQFSAYLGCIFVLFNYLRYLKFSLKRTLWTVLIFASLPAAIVEASSTQTNLVVAFFLFVSLYLFIYGVKENSKKALIFSAIAFCFNIGVKYSTFFFVPIFGLIYLLIAYREKKESFHKPIIIFIAAAIPSFLILASYNHILNYIEFGNFFGSQPYIDRLSAPYGIRTFLANLIRYSILFIDFSGMQFADAFTSFYIGIKDFLFGVLGLQPSDGLVFAEIFKINTRIHESYSQFGLLGFLLLLPLIFKYSFKKANLISGNKIFYISITGLITVGFVLVMSIAMGFCLWNNRFLLTPVVLSSTIFALSYTRKNTPIKILIALVVAFNFLIIPVFNTSRPLFGISKLLFEEGYSIFRQNARFLHEDYFPEKITQSYTMIKFLGLVAPNNSKIAILLSNDDLYYPFYEENPTWKIYQLRYENLAKKKNYNDYDFIVISHLLQQCEIVDYKNIKFDYYIRENGLVSSFDGIKKPVVLYQGRKGEIITSGKPYMQYNAIIINDIPDNFKLIKNFTTIIEPNDRIKTYNKKDTYIYKKMF